MSLKLILHYFIRVSSIHPTESCYSFHHSQSVSALSINHPALTKFYPTSHSFPPFRFASLFPSHRPNSRKCSRHLTPSHHSPFLFSHHPSRYLPHPTGNQTLYLSPSHPDPTLSCVIPTYQNHILYHSILLDLTYVMSLHPTRILLFVVSFHPTRTTFYIIPSFQISFSGPVMVSSTLCPAVHISGSLNVYSRAKGVADHYWPRAVFYIRTPSFWNSCAVCHSIPPQIPRIMMSFHPSCTVKL